MASNPRSTLASVSARFLTRERMTVMPMRLTTMKRFATAYQTGPGGDRKNPTPVSMAERAAITITGDDCVGVEYIARKISGAR